MYYSQGLEQLGAYTEFIRTISDRCTEIIEISINLFIERIGPILEDIRETLIEFAEYLKSILECTQESTNLHYPFFINDEVPIVHFNEESVSMRGPPMFPRDDVEVFFIYIIIMLQPVVTWIAGGLASDTFVRAFGAILHIMGLQ